MTGVVRPGPLGTERAVAAATAAGLAEGALWALPVSGAAKEAAGLPAGPLVSWEVFVVWFAVAVALFTVLRRSRALPAIGATLGLGVGAWQALAGTPDVVGAVVVEALGIGVLLRAVMLATRDWREPSTSFGWGSAALLVEVVMSRRAGWTPAVPVVVPVFVLASLASRGLTTWAAPGGADGAAVTPAPLGRWMGSVLSGLAVAGAGMGVAVGLGTRGGLLQGMGRVVIPLGVLVVVVAGFALTEKGTPAALADRGGRWLAAVPFIAMGVAVAWVISKRQHRRTFFRIFTGIPLRQQAPSTGTIERIFGLVLFVAIAYLLLRAFRARWTEPEGPRRRAATAAVAVRSVGPVSRPPRPRRRRGELPQDVVRRWYAETLEVLEDKNLPRPSSRTPGEFSRDVLEALPECGSGMRALTLAYERVRYGLNSLDQDDLRALDGERRRLLATIAEHHPLERQSD